MVAPGAMAGMVPMGVGSLGMGMGGLGVGVGMGMGLQQGATLLGGIVPNRGGLGGF